jgi:alcohol dehydrogenase class IV
MALKALAASSTLPTTQNAVVTDQHDIQVKASLRHAVFVPQVAILDPEGWARPEQTGVSRSAPAGG